MSESICNNIVCSSAANEDAAVALRANKMTFQVKEMINNRQSEELKRFPYHEEVPRDAVVLYMRSLGTLMNDEITSSNVGFSNTRFTAKSGKVFNFTYGGRKDGIEPIRTFMIEVAKWVGSATMPTDIGMKHANIIGEELQRSINEYEKDMMQKYNQRIDGRVAGMINTYLHRMNVNKEQTIYEVVIKELHMRSEVSVTHEQKTHVLVLTVLDTPEIAIDKMAVFFSKFIKQ